MWREHRKNNLNEIKNSEENIWLAGDGQFDSPGFCAKYCAYSIMDLHSSKIIDFNLVQKGMGSGDLERKACESFIDKLIEEHCNIELFENSNWFRRR